MNASPPILESPADRQTGAPARPDYARRIDELGKIIATYSDITDRLQRSHEQLTATVIRLRSELSEKNRLLERRNRLAALGEMAAGMAHEIRNPLGGIQLYASLLAKDVADQGPSLDLVRKISGGVKRLEGIVGQVLQFTREVHANPEQVDLAEVIEQAVEYASQTLEDRDIACVVNGPRPMPVTVDALLLGQAILNLLLNAADAIGHSGKINVSYGAPPAGSDAKQFHLTLIDSGAGIPLEVLDRIFNPFFTTKDTGTGLGLAIVHRVIEAHDGQIIAGNEPGAGAKFELRV